MATVAIIEPSITRGDLADRIERIARDARLVPTGDLYRQVEAVRSIAAAGRLLPLARLAGGLRDALADGGGRAAVRPWVDAMRESLGVDAQDEATARAFVASVGIRLAG